MLSYFLKLLVDVHILGLRVGVFKLRTREVVLLGSDVGENLKEIGRGGNKGGRGGSNRDDGQRINDEWGQEGGRANGGVGEDRDGEQGRCIADWTWVVPSVIGAIEEILNDLVGSGNIDLVNVLNLRPRGDRQGGGGDGGGSGSGDKRRQHLNTFN